MNQSSVLVKKGRIYSPEEFVRYVSVKDSPDNNAYYTFLNNTVVHQTVPQLIESINAIEADRTFDPIPPVQKPEKCIVKGCTNAPCRSHICDYHCPEHVAKTTVFLRTPDLIPKEKYMGRPGLGSEVTVRCISDDEEANHYKFSRAFIIRFEKGKLSISIGGRPHMINKWCYYVEERDGKRFPIFEIHDNIYFQDLLKGDYTARFEGQPCCEELLKGYKCECMAEDYPYQDSLPERLAPRGVTGVFPMNKRGGKVFKCGRHGVRCAQYRRATSVEEKKPVLKKSAPVVNRDDPKIMHALVDMQQSKMDYQELLLKQRTSEIQIMERTIAQHRSRIADLEKDVSRLETKLYIK
jgi:hypothetical protein